MATVTGYFTSAAIGLASVPYPVKASTLAAKVLTANGVSNDYDAVIVGATGATSRIHVTGITNPVPALATINSITITINRFNDNTATSVTDSEVKLIRAGTVESTNKATGTQYPGALATATYGGDLWGASWLEADLNDSGFGVAFSAAIQDYAPGDLFGGLARFDYVAYSIDYTAYSPPATSEPEDKYWKDGGTYHTRARIGYPSGAVPQHPYAGVPTAKVPVEGPFTEYDQEFDWEGA